MRFLRKVDNCIYARFAHTELGLAVKAVSQWVLRDVVCLPGNSTKQT